MVSQFYKACEVLRSIVSAPVSSETVARLRPATPLEASNAENHDGPICEDDPRPLIPEGTYDAVCSHARRHLHPGFKREVIKLDLQIWDGPYNGVILSRYFPSQSAGRRGSGFYREWTVANRGVPPRRRDRMALSKFKGKLFRVRVKTVERSWDGRTLPPSLFYSKVGEILELLQTNDAPRN